MLGLGRWRPRHLLVAWIPYWVVLVAAKLGGALARWTRVIWPWPARGSA